MHLGLALSERIPENGVIIINQQPRSPLLIWAILRRRRSCRRSTFRPISNSSSTFSLLPPAALVGTGGGYGSFIDQTGAVRCSSTVVMPIGDTHHNT